MKKVVRALQAWARNNSRERLTGLSLQPQALGQAVRMLVMTPEGRRLKPQWSRGDKVNMPACQTVQSERDYFSPHTWRYHSCSNIYLGLYSEKASSSVRFKHFPIPFYFCLRLYEDFLVMCPKGLRFYWNSSWSPKMVDSGTHKVVKI